LAEVNSGRIRAEGGVDNIGQLPVNDDLWRASPEGG
jgi:hypothetical protein